MIYGIIYTNYDKKWLVRARKSEIPWNKFKGLAAKEKNEFLVYIYFKINI